MDRSNWIGRREALAVIAITTMALLLRVWGIQFGFPHTLTRPDEEIIIPLALRLWNGPNPHFFDWPTLYPYVLSGVYATYFAIGRLTGQFASVADFVATTTANPIQLHLIDRVVVAVLGTATVPLVYVSARRLFSSQVALVAAALFAVAVLHVRESHFGMTDVPATFMIMLAFAFMVLRPVDSRHLANVLVAAILCGLATATKYNAAVIAVPLLVLVAEREWSGKWSAGRFVLACGLMSFGITLGFFLGAPYAILDYPAFRNGILMQRAHLAEGHGTALAYGWTHHLLVSLRYGLGWPMLVAAGLGAIRLLRVDLKTAAVVLSFPLIYYAGIGSGKTVFARYMLPIIPFVCLLAAIAVSWLAAPIRRLYPSAGVVALVGLTVLAGSLSVARSFAFDRLVSRDDTRVVAARTLEASFPAPSTVYQFGTDYARLQLPARFQAWIPDPALNPMEAPADALPELVIIPSSPLPVYTPPPGADIYEILRRRYKPLARYDAEIPERDDDIVFDTQDAFFVPLTGFRKIRRPGPTIEIFQRTGQ